MRDGWRTRGTAHVFGDDIVHDGMIIPVRVVGARVTDPAELATHLFSEHRPAFRDRVKPGDFVVGGRNFGCGKPHTGGYIGMEGLGLRLLCESMPGAIVRATMNLALPCMPNCAGITGFVQDGDAIEVDFETGAVINHRSGESRTYPAPAPRVREMIRRGGLRGSLVQYLAEHPDLAVAPA